MESDKTTLIQKFNRGELSPQDCDRLEQLFMENQIDIDALESFSHFTRINEGETFEMDQLDYEFHALLNRLIKATDLRFTKKRLHDFAPILRLAIPIVALFFGLYIGSIGNRVPAPQKVISAIPLNMEKGNLLYRLVDDPLVTNRVQALASLENTYDDGRKIDLLFYSLNNDRSTVVRIEALEAILNYSNRPEIKKRLIASIKRQESPYLVQYLSEVLQRMEISITKEQLRELLPQDIPAVTLKHIETHLYTSSI